MMKKLFALVLALAMLFTLTACGSTPAADQPAADKPAADQPVADKPVEETPAEPIRIGIVTTLSGSNSGHGEYCKEGAELWLDDVNARGGILGRPVEIVYEDNGETNQEYQNAFIKMLSEGDVSAVYSNGYSDQITLVSPDVESYGIPLLAGNSSQACLDSGYEYYWMLRLSDMLVMKFHIE